MLRSEGKYPDTPPLDDICLDTLHLSVTCCVQKANALTLLIKKADAMALVIWRSFALTLYVGKTHAASRREMP